MEFVEIPAGWFWMGWEEGLPDARPRHRVWVDAFAIARRPVTTAEYRGYVEATGAPTGWAWMQHLHQGDYLNFLGVVVFTTITVVCYARILPMLPRLHAALAAIQIAVLLAAAFL